MKIATRVVGVSRDKNVYSLFTDACEIRIMFLTDDIVRIRAGFDGSFKEESYSLVLTGWNDRLDSFMEGHRKRIELATIKVSDVENRIILQGKKLKVVVDKDPFKLCIYDEENHLIHSDITDLAYMEDSNFRRIHTSEIMPGDCFYGFGEKTGEINKHYKSMSMSPRDSMGYNPKESDSLYKHIPFYIKANRESKIASGYFYHTTYECDFDMGRAHSNYWKQHSRFRTDGGDIDLFFIAGPTIKDVVRRYTDLTGKSAMLPKYALGYLGSSMYYSELSKDCDKAILDFVDTAKDESIPIDGFQLSSGYCNKDGQRYFFTWNDDRFKDPKNFFDEMEKRGVTTSPNVKPGLLLSHPYIEEMKQEDIFVKSSSNDGQDAVGTWWGGKGIFADFTNPHTREVWKKYLTKYVLSYGVKSIWNDNCEYESIFDKDAIVDFEGEKATIGQLRSVMANIMCHITNEAIEKEYENMRPFVVCRAGHAGIQRYAQSWAGDNFTSWDSLKYNISTILGMALSGVTNFGCDVGGFYGDAPEEELFIRWVQHGIFYPRFSIHSVNTDNTVTEPWMYSNSKDLIREAIQFRYQLSPYYYSLMVRAAETGLPIIQPLFMKFQNDNNCYDNGTDFILGESLLIANILEKGQLLREIYLPEGHSYYNFYTRKKYNGGQVITVPVDITSIPMFVIGGSITELSANKIANLHTDAVTDLRLLIAPDNDCELIHYEDDGVSMDFKKEIYLKEKISVIAGEIVKIKVEREGNYQSQVTNVILDIVNDKSPYWVTINDKEIPHIQNRKKFEAAQKGWYFSQTLRSVLIKYSNPKKDYEVKVSFENFDMLGM